MIYMLIIMEREYTNNYKEQRIDSRGVCGNSSVPGHVRKPLYIFPIKFQKIGL